MDEGQGVRYWCHSCEEVIDPTMPELKCPGCDGGFVEEMDSEYFEPVANTRSDRSLSNHCCLGCWGAQRVDQDSGGRP
jgi:E3 ubiquitin-protein ligase RNF115/126